MRKLAPLACALALAGCSAAQDEIRRDGKRFQTSSTRTPLGAVSCVRRNIEEAGGLTISTREAAEPGAFEFSARKQNADSVVMYVHALPIQKGSFITAWISPMHPNPEGTFANAVKGC